MKKKVTILMFLLFQIIVVGAQDNGNENIRHFYVGTYTDSGSEGIYRFGLDLNSGKIHYEGLSAMSENPSFLALTADRKFLLAVHETNDEKGKQMGYVESFSVGSNGALTSVGMVLSGGAHPCYVSVNPEGLVLAANYTGGNVALFKLDENGKLSETLDVKQHIGKGPNGARQEKPHVHSAYFEPEGNRIFVADLGIDRVKVYVADGSGGKLNPYKASEIVLAPGSGPRHMAFHPNKELLFIVNELTSSVSVVRLLADGNYKIVQTVSSLPDGFNQENTCADIHLSPDGKFLYVSNRGLNSIAVFSVNGKSGQLKQIGQEPTRGETPRNFTLSPDGQFLLVANQNSQNIVSFRRDQTSGKLTFVNQVNAHKPVCLLFE